MSYHGALIRSRTLTGGTQFGIVRLDPKFEREGYPAYVVFFDDGREIVHSDRQLHARFKGIKNGGTSEYEVICEGVGGEQEYVIHQQFRMIQATKR